jgi:hypothetical protein
MTIAETHIDRESLIQKLIDYRNDLRKFPREDISDEEGNAYGDCRLQVHGGTWTLWTGDSSYDTDHRGYWGANSVSPDDDKATLEAVADDLLDECADDFAMGD